MQILIQNNLYFEPYKNDKNVDLIIVISNLQNKLYFAIFV
jgi:hypothetical protein